MLYISAVAGSDYNAVSVELTFVPGQTHLSVIVGIIKDDECERPNEIFTGVLINTLSDPLLMVTPNVTTVTIDDDLEPECRKYLLIWLAVYHRCIVAIVYVTDKPRTSCVYPKYMRQLC